MQIEQLKAVMIAKYVGHVLQAYERQKWIISKEDNRVYPLKARADGQRGVTMQVLKALHQPVEGGLLLQLRGGRYRPTLNLTPGCTQLTVADKDEDRGWRRRR
jgi:hypothetical protein